MISRGFVAAFMASALAGIVSSMAVAEEPKGQKSDVGVGAYGDAAETVHKRRFQDLLDAFAAGRSTTRYDTVSPLAGAPNASPLVRVDSPTIAKGALDDIRRYAADHRSTALLVYRNGALEAEHYFGDVTRETPLKSKSLAKPLGVIAIGRAINMGAIDSLDQRASDFITEWQGTPKEDILVRHILDMRSGLLRQGYSAELNNILNRAYLHPHHDDVIINYYPLTDEPGGTYEYSNATAELVAPLIERSTGIQYETFLEEQVLGPLGAMGGNIWMNRDGGTAHSGCCVQLPAETWLRLAILVLNNGVWEGEALLPDGFVREMKTSTPQNLHAGMGVFLGHPYKEWRGVGNPDNDFSQSFHSEAYLDDELVLFDGNGNQVAYIVPSEQLVILRMGESPPKDTPWDNAYMPNLILTALGKD
ncbi:MAG: serine hydrolase [Pseudomonadota bacterium]